MKTTNKIIIINKPKNYTSRDIVNIVGNILNTKKIGHTGTLDPLATGVLVLCTGRYTKLVNILTSLDKEYIAEIKLGIKTDTLDITGKIIEEKPFQITKEEIEKVLASFKGNYHMQVPIYSAVKINGKKLYEYARNNESIELPTKDVKIYDIKLLEFKNDIIKFKVLVEKGTYIRSLIRDICASLNTIGTMNNLIRTKQGKFNIEDSFSLEDIENNNYKFLNVKEALNLNIYNLNHQEFKKVINGNKIVIPKKDQYLLLTYNDEEIAIYKREEESYQCYVMLKI